MEINNIVVDNSRSVVKKIKKYLNTFTQILYNGGTYSVLPVLHKLGAVKYFDLGIYFILTIS